MDYEKKYKEAIERAKEQLEGAKVFDYKDGQIAHDIRTVTYAIFPELTESEDEKIRKELIQYLKDYPNLPNGNYCRDDFFAWLEKQKSIDILDEEERKFVDNVDSYRKEIDEAYQKGYNEGVKVTLEKQGEQKSKEISLWKHWKDGIAGNGGGKPIYLIKAGNTYNLSSGLGFECDYIELLELDKLLSEKQSEQKPADKVEPKFNIEKGKWYVCNTSRYTDFIVGKVYYCPKNGMLRPNENEIARYVASDCFRLWTIEDAKDGDVITNWNNTTFIFKAIEDETVKFHIAYNEKWDAIKTPSTKLSHLGLSEPQFEFHPATKEQRDLLFQKMREACYEWDAEKKKIKNSK